MKVIFEPKEHKYYDENNREFPSVTTILKHFGMTPDYDRFGNEASRSFGEAIHKLFELYDTDNLGEYDPQLEPYLNGYIKFKEEHKPEWKIVEAPLISTVWGFAGTPDRDNLDIKTGSEEPYHALQTAAYSILIEENYKIKHKIRYTYIALPGTYKLIPHKDKSDRAIFLGLVQAYQWKQKKGLIK